MYDLSTALTLFVCIRFSMTSTAYIHMMNLIPLPLLIVHSMKDRFWERLTSWKNLYDRFSMSTLILDHMQVHLSYHFIDVRRLHNYPVVNAGLIYNCTRNT